MISLLSTDAINKLPNTHTV